MNQYVTTGIVIKRVNYGEADRIMTFLTPKRGKIRGMAKGVRREKSKLAGGIELFSEADLTLIKGRGEIDTLISTRLKINYGNIVKDLTRTNAGYDFISIVDAVTEDNYEESYYSLLSMAFKFLNVEDLNPELTKCWFYTKLLDLTGYTPELGVDVNDEPLQENESYLFDFSAGRFQPSSTEGFSTNVIKLLRLLQKHTPAQIDKVGGTGDALVSASQILSRLAEYYLHIKK